MKKVAIATDPAFWSVSVLEVMHAFFLPLTWQIHLIVPSFENSQFYATKHYHDLVISRDGT